MMKRCNRTERLFRLVCIAFSVVMLLSCILCRIGIMQCENEIDMLHKNIAKAESEAELYRVRIENIIGLDELEHEAIERLGMHRPTSEQLFFSMTAG